MYCCKIYFDGFLIRCFIVRHINTIIPVVCGGTVAIHHLCRRSAVRVDLLHRGRGVAAGLHLVRHLLLRGRQQHRHGAQLERAQRGQHGAEAGGGGRADDGQVDVEAGHDGGDEARGGVRAQQRGHHQQGVAGVHGGRLEW